MKIPIVLIGKRFDLQAYQYEKLGVDSGGYDIYDRRFVGTYLDNTYSFNKTRAVLTFNDHVYSYLITNAQIKENFHSDNPEYDVFYVFEIKVAKHQVLDPTNSEESYVTTMQAIK